MQGHPGAARATMQDPDQMRAVFQAHLRPTDGSAIDVQSCQVDYARLSPSRSVLQYTLGIAGSANGQLSRQVVTGTSFGAERTRALWSQLVASQPDARQAIGPLALPAVSYVPDLDLLLQVFPFDVHLPGLRRLTEASPELMAALFADVGPGAWRLESWSSDVARYRPDMRATLRVEVAARQEATGELEHRRAYAKVYRELDEGRHAYAVLQALWERTWREEAGFAVARPLAFLDDLRTLLISDVPGDRVLEVRRQSARPEAEAALRQAARAIASLHQVSLPDGLLPQARQDKPEQLSAVAAQLSQAHPGQAARIAALVAEITRSLRSTPLAPTHYDLKQGHLLIAGDQVTILDFDKLAMGDPLVDVANVAATLGAERDGTRQRAERRGKFVEAFVDAYFASVPPDWRAAFPAHLALATLVEAGTTGRGMRGRPKRDGHGERVATALTQAERALRGELW